MLQSTRPGLWKRLQVCSFSPELTIGKTASFSQFSPKQAQIVVESSSQPPSQRIVSSGSIADPSQGSAGGTRVWASSEKSSDIFANNFIIYVMGWIWENGVTLDWVQGRNGVTALEWNNSYSHCRLTFANCRAQEAILTMKDTTVAARNDGSLQIEIADPDSDTGSMFWSRQYYVLPLEVSDSTTISALSLADNRRNDSIVSLERKRKPQRKSWTSSMPYLRDKCSQKC